MQICLICANIFPCLSIHLSVFMSLLFLCMSFLLFLFTLSLSPPFDRSIFALTIESSRCHLQIVESSILTHPLPHPPFGSPRCAVLSDATNVAEANQSSPSPANQLAEKTRSTRRRQPRFFVSQLRRCCRCCRVRVDDSSDGEGGGEWGMLRGEVLGQEVGSSMSRSWRVFGQEGGPSMSGLGVKMLLEMTLLSARASGAR